MWINLIASGSLKFVDILSHVQPGADTLRPLLDLVQKFVDDGTITTPRFLVVFDGICTLEWLGFTATEVGRLSRALSALCRKVPFSGLPFLETNLTSESQSSVSLFLRHHILDREVIDSTFSLLQQLVAYGSRFDPSQAGKVVPLAERLGIVILPRNQSKAE
jgi:hypothetical protein